MADKEEKDIVEAVLDDIRKEVKKIPLEDMEPKDRMLEPEELEVLPEALPLEFPSGEELEEIKIRQALVVAAEKEAAEKAAKKTAKKVRKDASNKLVQAAVEKAMAARKGEEALAKKLGKPSRLEKFAVGITGGFPGLLLGTYDRNKKYNDAVKVLHKELGIGVAAAKTAAVKLAAVPESERQKIAVALDIAYRRTADGSLPKGWSKGILQPLPDGRDLPDDMVLPALGKYYDTVMFQRPHQDADQQSPKSMMWELSRTQMLRTHEFLTKFDTSMREGEKVMSSAIKQEAENLGAGGGKVTDIKGWDKLAVWDQRVAAAVFRKAQLAAQGSTDKRAESLEDATIQVMANNARLHGLEGAEVLPKEFLDKANPKYHDRLNQMFNQGAREKRLKAGDELTESLKATRLAIVKAEGEKADWEGKGPNDNPHDKDKFPLDHSTWELGRAGANLKGLERRSQREWSKEQNLKSADASSAGAVGGYDALNKANTLKSNPYAGVAGKGEESAAWIRGFLTTRKGMDEGLTADKYKSDNAEVAFFGQIKKAYEATHFGATIPLEQLEALRKASPNPWQASASKLGELRDLQFMQQEYNSLFAKATSPSAVAAQKLGYEKFDPTKAPAANRAPNWFNATLLKNRIARVYTESGAMVRAKAVEGEAGEVVPFRYVNRLSGIGELKSRTWEVVAGLEWMMRAPSEFYKFGPNGTDGGVPRVLTKKELADGMPVGGGKPNVPWPVAPDGKTYLPDYWWKRAQEGLAIEAMTHKVKVAGGPDIDVALRDTTFQDPTDPQWRKPVIPQRSLKLDPTAQKGAPPPASPGVVVPDVNVVRTTPTSPATHAFLLVKGVRTKIPVDVVQSLPNKPDGSSGGTYIIVESGGKLRVVTITR